MRHINQQKHNKNVLLEACLRSDDTFLILLYLFPGVCNFLYNLNEITNLSPTVTNAQKEAKSNITFETNFGYNQDYFYWNSCYEEKQKKRILKERVV